MTAFESSSFPAGPSQAQLDRQEQIFLQWFEESAAAPRQAWFRRPGARVGVSMAAAFGVIGTFVVADAIQSASAAAATPTVTYCNQMFLDNNALGYWLVQNKGASGARVALMLGEAALNMERTDSAGVQGNVVTEGSRLASDIAGVGNATNARDYVTAMADYELDLRAFAAGCGAVTGKSVPIVSIPSASSPVASV